MGYPTSLSSKSAQLAKFLFFLLLTRRAKERRTFMIDARIEPSSRVEGEAVRRGPLADVVFKDFPVTNLQSYEKIGRASCRERV